MDDWSGMSIRIEKLHRVMDEALTDGELLKARNAALAIDIELFNIRKWIVDRLNDIV